MCDDLPDILSKDVWITIGYTYDASEQKYYLIRESSGNGLCLACTQLWNPDINIKAFCYECKAPRPVDWTTGNKSLDSFIMESWSNTSNKKDAYIQWIEYSLFTDVREMTSLRHGCTHVAEWTTNELTRVTLKKIVDEEDDQLLDFYQVNYLVQIVLLTCVSRA